MENNNSVARITQAGSGDYIISDDALPYIDETGDKYPTREEAIEAARWMEEVDYESSTGRRPAYTHYLEGSELVELR